MKRIEPGPGQESVWDYPRPPLLESTTAALRVLLGGQVIAETGAAYRVLETSHPPTYYFPPGDVDLSCLRETERRTACEWKGLARYFDVLAGGERRPAAAWAYPQPVPAFAALADHVAFFASAMDLCSVDGETVDSQEGDFYGGWITSQVVGPFKGAGGTWGW